jgi:photosystem II stability/assembly factor-like uncharacterized protein
MLRKRWWRNVFRINMLRHILVVVVIIMTTFFEQTFCQNKNVTINQTNNSAYTLSGRVPIRMMPSQKTFTGRVSFPAKSNSLFKASKIQSATNNLFQALPGPMGGTVRDIVADTIAGLLYAATDGGLYYSIDNGQHWNTQLFPSQVWNSIGQISVLGPKIVAAQTDFNVYISFDGGESWNYPSSDVQGFAVDTNGDIYAGSSNEGIKKSIDTAKTWKQFSLYGKKIYSVIIQRGGHFICSSDSGLYFSTDSGNTWDYKPYNGEFNWSLCSDHQGNLFSIQDFRLYKSSDFGNSWTLLSQSYLGSEDLYRINAEKNDHLFALTSSHILESTDAGVTWNIIPCFIGGPLGIGYDLHNNILTGFFYGLFRYDPVTEAWTESDQGIHTVRIEGIQFTANGTIFVPSLGRYYLSTDGGATWSNRYYDSDVTVYYYPTNFTDSFGNIFVNASFNGESGFVRSTDNGLSWKKLPVLSNWYAIEGVVEKSPGELIAGSYSGTLYRSTDDGNSWTKLYSSTDNIQCITIDSAGYIYAVADTSVLVSNDGTTWTKYLFRQNSYGDQETAVVDKQGRIFIGTFGDGVYMSSDRGKTWHLNNNGLSTCVLSAVADDSDNVFIGSYGIYQLADSVDIWSSFGNNYPITYIEKLSLSPQKYLFAGTQSYGLFKSVLPITKRMATVNPPKEIHSFQLYQNYPNPFNSSTQFNFDLPQPSKVTLKIYDLLGREIVTIISGETLSKGSYTRQWNAGHCASGVYFYRLQTETFSRTKKLMLLR